MGDASGQCTWLLVIPAALVAFILWERCRRVFRLIDKLPGWPAIPFLGNLRYLRLFWPPNYEISHMNVLMFQIACGLCHIFGKEGIFRVWITVHPIVAFYRAKNVEVLLKSNTLLHKAPEYRLLHGWLGTGLLTSYGKKWRSQRKILTPAFHFRILENFVPIFNEQSEVLIEKLGRLSNEEWVNITPLVTLCTLDVICESAMGVHINAQRRSNSSYVKAVYGMGETFTYRLIRPWLWWDPLFARLPSGRGYRNNVRLLKDVTKKMIEEKKSVETGDLKNGRSPSVVPFTRSQRKVFLDMLLSYQQEDPSFTDEYIQEEVDTFMFEGHDTTAMGITWALYNLGLYPEVQKNVFEEIEAIVGDDRKRQLTSDDIKELRYLECVLKESQRLFPSVPMIGREVCEDIVVDGFTIPKGTTCFIPIYMLHRDPDVFPNPEVFDPDRFLPESSYSRHPYAYIPFSAGPRNCIGQRFAMMEEKIIVANILRNFSVYSLDARDKIQLLWEMVLRPYGPLRLRFLPRSP